MQTRADRIHAAYAVLCERTLYPQFDLSPQTALWRKARHLRECLATMTVDERRLFLDVNGQGLLEDIAVVCAGAEGTLSSIGNEQRG